MVIRPGAFPSPSPTVFECIVRGKPEPQGSKVKGRWGGFHEDNANLKPWRHAVTAAAVDARLEWLETPFPLDGPIIATMVFTMRRPVSHLRTGLHAGDVKESFLDAWPSGKPDVSKLARAVEDALTDAGVWADDARLIGYAPLFKTYPSTTPFSLDSPGVWISLRRPQ